MVRIIEFLSMLLYLGVRFASLYIVMTILKDLIKITMDGVKNNKKIIWQEHATNLLVLLAQIVIIPVLVIGAVNLAFELAEPEMDALTETLTGQLEEVVDTVFDGNDEVYTMPAYETYNEPVAPVLLPTPTVAPNAPSYDPNLVIPTRPVPTATAIPQTMQQGGGTP